MRVPERPTVRRGVPVPGLRFRPVPDEGGDQDIARLEVIPLEDDRHRAARLGVAVLDEPRMPEPLGALRVHDLIAVPRGDTDRLTDRPTEVNLLDEKLSALAIDLGDRGGQEPRDAVMYMTLVAVVDHLTGLQFS